VERIPPIQADPVEQPAISARIGRSLRAGEVSCSLFSKAIRSITLRPI